MTAHEKKLLNEMNSTAFDVKLGDIIEAGITETATKAILFKKALVAGEITAGVATVATGVTWTNFAGVTVTAADGTVRAITNVAAVAGAGNTQKIAVTATGVTATDVLRLSLV